MKILDVQTDDPLSLIRDILSCELIASSSLHGIVAADAYGVPSIWLKFSDKVFGQSFKFIDYFESVGRRDRNPLTVDGDTTISEVLDSYSPYRIDIDLDALLQSCPILTGSDGIEAFHPPSAGASGVSAGN